MTPEPQPTREHAIDGVRVFALLLLIVYHCAVLFQPWSSKLGWIQNDRVIPLLWDFMLMINAWRIPILFLVSGMGVFFAMQRRNNAELLKDRAARILLPYIVGAATFGPLCSGLDQIARGESLHFDLTDYHLWFLLNISVYVLVFLPFFRWIHNRPDGVVLQATRWLFRTGWFVPAFALPGFLALGVIQPEHFESYHHKPHGWVYGGICFCLGFISASVISDFKDATRRWRWGLSIAAFVLWTLRINGIWRADGWSAWHNPMMAVESMVSMLAVMGQAFRYWDGGFRGLRYANAAVYPVYIIHQPMQNLLAFLVLAVSWNPWLEFGLLSLAILGSSIVLYEGVRRVQWLRPVFGMKRTPKTVA